MDDVFSVQVALWGDKVSCTMMMESHTSQMSAAGSPLASYPGCFSYKRPGYEASSRQPSITPSLDCKQWKLMVGEVEAPNAPAIVRYAPCQLKCLSRWIFSYAKEMGTPGEQIDSSTVAHIGLVIRPRPTDRKLGGARTTMARTYKVLDSFTKCSTIRVFCQTTWHDIKTYSYHRLIPRLLLSLQY